MNTKSVSEVKKGVKPFKCALQPFKNTFLTSHNHSNDKQNSPKNAVFCFYSGFI